MTKLTTEERLVKLEVLMGQVLAEVKELKAEVKAANQAFVTVDRHQEDLNDLKAEIKNIKASRWTQNLFLVLLTTAMTLLLTFFVTNVGKQ